MSALDSFNLWQVSLDSSDSINDVGRRRAMKTGAWQQRCLLFACGRITAVGWRSTRHQS